jgi:hypothetical protein
MDDPAAGKDGLAGDVGLSLAESKSLMLGCRRPWFAHR